MKVSLLILSFLLSLGYMSCSESTTSNPPVPPQNFPQTPFPQDPNNNPPYSDPCISTLPNTDSQQTNPDPATDNSGSSFDDPNRFNLTDELSSDTLNDLLNAEESSNNVSTTTCPDPDITPGENGTDNEHINNFLKPKALTDCNASGKIYHRQAKECLDAYTYETTWCTQDLFANEFGANKQAIINQTQAFFSGGYQIDQCGRTSDGALYVSFLKWKETDSGIEAFYEWKCTQHAACPTE